MNKIKIILRNFTIFGIFCLSKIGFSQSINFNYTNGSQASYNISDIRKVTFTNDVMNMNLIDGTVYSWNVSTIGQYDYTDNSTTNGKLISTSNSMQLSISPNPSASNVNIRYNLLKENTITIGLFDTNGKQVYTIFNGLQKKGEQAITFNKGDLTSGIYLCKIIGRDFSITKQIILN